jgi:hypothetical protein
VDHRLVVGSLEGELTREHLVQDDAQRPDVSPVIHVLATCLLRRHVGHSAHRRVAPGQVRATLQLGQPEVHDLSLRVWSHHDFAALDIAVDGSLRVRLAQAGGDLDRDVQNLCGRGKAAEIGSDQEDAFLWADSVPVYSYRPPSHLFRKFSISINYVDGPMGIYPYPGSTFQS